MKKRTILTLMALLLIPIAALSFSLNEWMRVDTGNTTSGNLVQTKPGYFYGVIVHTDGTNAVTVNVYDTADVSAGASLLLADWIVTTSATDRTQSIGYMPPVAYENGIQVDVSTSGTVTYDVYYRASDD